MGKQYVNPEGRIPMTGDWVRFYRGGELIIACVQYILEEEKHYPFDKQLCTDKGCVSLSDVMEAR